MQECKIEMIPNDLFGMSYLAKASPAAGWVEQNDRGEVAAARLEGQCGHHLALGLMPLLGNANQVDPILEN